ncbi:hypothetical protein [Priestia aryabhattai]
MSINDHIIFRECIPHFRPENFKEYYSQNPENELVNYMLFDFNLTQEINTEHFKISPTKTVHVPIACSAFISNVTQPHWVRPDTDGIYFNIALSAVTSFSIGRPVRAHREYRYLIGRPFDGQDLGKLLPIITGGPGAYDTRLTRENEDKYIYNIKEAVEVLFDLPDNVYIYIMQAIRMIHLAHLNKREDFALSYSLIISAIEAIAQKYKSKEEKLKEKEEKERKKNRKLLEPKWIELSKDNLDIQALFDEYQDLLSKKSGDVLTLTERFVNFILENCPIEKWNEFEHPRKNRSDKNQEDIKKSSLPEEFKRKMRPSPYELIDGIQPTDLTLEQINNILRDLYKHRSKFVHRGESPPHIYPVSYSRFFDSFLISNKENDELNEIVVPTYDFLSFIAYHSIINFAKSKIKH